ncbi:BTAD domain-containing putative transcriptional regulator [Streptomyces sp. NPDC051572]|uniref:BTAD domain-containing putative transcriptional regulator n=1 Tax=Streptomyces sp. NPDC051572 TaxID=3155802 RepID=UPI00345031B7
MWARDTGLWTPGAAQWTSAHRSAARGRQPDRHGGPEVGEALLRALARRSDADLHLGRHRELLPDMKVLVNQQRMHESPHGRFMVALHCAGRHGEALGVYRRLRTNLVAEPGLGSSAALAVLLPGGLPRRLLRDRPGGDRPVHRPTRHSRGRVAEMTRSTLRTAEGGARRTPDRSRTVLAPLNASVEVPWTSPTRLVLLLGCELGRGAGLPDGRTDEPDAGASRCARGGFRDDRVAPSTWRGFSGRALPGRQPGTERRPTGRANLGWRLARTVQGAADRWAPRACSELRSRDRSFLLQEGAG